MNYHNSNTIHIKSVELLVKNLKQITEFYTNIIGLNIINEQENFVVLSANKLEPLITLITQENVEKKTRTQGLYHFALLLSNKTGLANVFYHILKNNYPITGLSDHGVSNAIYLEDPEGNGIELYCDKNESEWPTENGKPTMFTKSLSIDYLLSQKSNDEFEKINPNTILGHLHLQVANVKKSKEFYENIIGFKLFLNYLNSAMFLSSSNYHHHLEINDWMGNAPLKKQNQVGLVSYTLNIPNNKKEQFLYNLQKNNITIYKTKENKPYILDLEQQKIYF